MPDCAKVTSFPPGLQHINLHDINIYTCINMCMYVCMYMYMYMYVHVNLNLVRNTCM